MLVSSPSYFAVEEMESIKAFFVQAYSQIGYYGYETEPFKGLLKIKNTNNYLQTVFLPKNLEFNHDKESMQRVKQFLDKNDPKMIFIYGEFDPWSATAVEFKDKENMFKFVKAKGSHKTRIKNLKRNQIKKVNKQINDWLDE